MSAERGAAGADRRVTLRSDLRGGDLGAIIALHGELYDPAAGFGLRFEAFVARTVSEYVLDNGARGRVWLAERDGRLVGCAALAERDGGRGQIRWVLVRPELRGTGLGRRLVECTLDYCRERGLDTVYLETTDGLDASMKLYEKLGFAVVEKGREELWDGERELIRMEMRLPAAAL